MKKIRINELARELEVKPGIILDLLPDLGVDEKKTHSSSIDEETAIALKDRLIEAGILGSDPHPSNGIHSDRHDEEGSHHSEREELSPVQEDSGPDLSKEINKGEARESVNTSSPATKPVASSVQAGGIRPPLRESSQSAAMASRPPAIPLRPSIPVPPSTQASAAAPTAPQSVAGAASDVKPEASPEVAPVPERPALRFQPLRPPLMAGTGGAVQPPLATPGAPPAGTPSRNVAIPARPLPQTPPRTGMPLGPRQPLPAEPEVRTAPTPGPRQPLPAPASPSRPIPSALAGGESQPRGLPGTPTAPPSRPAAPVTAPAPSSPADVSAASTPRPRPPIAPRQPIVPQRPIPPTHVVAPGGPGSAGPIGASPSGVPGAPIPSPVRPAPPRPSLTPGAPIAPRPQGPRPSLAGQPAARPIVPPRPDMVQRLRQQQTQQVRQPQGFSPGQSATPGMAAPGAPRPASPTPRSPAPGQPIFPRGPVRPGQPSMRGPSGPAGPGMPNYPGGPRRPGMRPMHPTSLRPESATPMPAEQQRRQFGQFGKPAGRPGPRKREDREEGNLRLRATKRIVAAEPPPIDREITVAEGITVKELSEKLNVKANLVIKKLVEKKIFATINQTLDVKLAEQLAREFGASTNQVSFEQESTQDLETAVESKDLVRRAPVVTIMGHVDHGKTSLLDAIRDTNVAGREAGGITQHIGAYRIEKNGRKIVFIDTPGHQAFTRMRARGAKVTDIVVLVVSADDGVMPQTLEAIDHAKAAKVPILVAINKIDKPDSQPDRVKQQLADRGLLAEDWGGDVVMTPVSAKTGQNLDLLLEMILLVADIQDLKANPERPALGTVLEAKLDRGRGPVATMLVRNGTFRVGDQFICGALFSKVRAMFDDRGNPVKEAEPSMPVEVIGLEALPEVGDSFQVVTDASKAKQIVIYREAKARDAAMAKGARVATLASLNQQFREGDLKDLNMIIKADVGGTAEVLSDTLQQLSNEKIRVRVLRTGVGAITEDDVLLASASEALIVGFNVKAERNAQSTAEQQKVDLRLHSIIYELIAEVQAAMTGLLEPVFKEVLQGHAEVRETFRISKVGTVAGCFVTDGAIRRDNQMRILRGGEIIHTGRIEALKRFKNDASEVKNGLECGISIAGFNNVNVGDILESFITERIAPQLPPPSVQ